MTHSDNIKILELFDVWKCFFCKTGLSRNFILSWASKWSTNYEKKHLTYGRYPVQKICPPKNGVFFLSFPSPPLPLLIFWVKVEHQGFWIESLMKIKFLLTFLCKKIWQQIVPRGLNFFFIIFNPNFSLFRNSIGII